MPGQLLSVFFLEISGENRIPDWGWKRSHQPGPQSEEWCILPGKSNIGVRAAEGMFGREEMISGVFHRPGYCTPR